MKKTIISLLALVFIYSCTPQDAPITFTDSRDGKVYKTVTIGSQVWMAKNLAYLPSVVGPDTYSHTEPYYYVYGYNGTFVAAAKGTTNYQTYGVLYNWPAALTACPDGWHLPSVAEWTQLTDYLGGTSVAGGKMKETGTAHWDSPNTGATNSSGFTALPGGCRFFDGSFWYIGDVGFWWSSTQLHTDTAWTSDLSYLFSSRGSYSKGHGFSVRCVRN
jgi:uncharacterized protein (TIGR02145 family)